MPPGGRHRGGLSFWLAVPFGTLVGTAAAVLLELFLIRPLYSRPRDQILATVGVGLAVPALLMGVWGADARPFPQPAVLSGTWHVLGATVPVNRFVLVARPRCCCSLFGCSSPVPATG